MTGATSPASSAGEGALVVPDPEAMQRFGHRVAALLRTGDVLVLTGELGAGKTTFTRGLGEALGVRGTVTSPTFVLARTHPRAGGASLVHVDAYRLGDAAELDDLDLDLPGSITVIEWGAGLVDAICDDWLELVIERPTGGAVGVGEGGRASADLAESAHSDEPDAEVAEPRIVRFRAVGPRGAELLSELL